MVLLKSSTTCCQLKIKKKKIKLNMTKETNFERKPLQKNFKKLKKFSFVKNFFLFKNFIHKINFLKVAKLLVVLQHHSTIRRAATAKQSLLDP